MRFETLMKMRTAVELALAHEGRSGAGAGVGTDPMQMVASTLDHAIDLQVAAGAFDVQAVTGQYSSNHPSDRWPTTALMRTTADSILSVPWSDALRRSILITSCLARLAERGISADAIVRTCLAPTAARHALFHSILAWKEASDPDDHPQQLRGWLKLLLELELPRHDMSTDEVFIAFTASDVWNAVDRWMRTAAVAHLVDWRIDDYLAVDIPPQSLVLPGGFEATWWLFDRFTATSTDDWMRSSLDWEIAYHHDPARVGATSGVSVELLDERPVCHEMAARSLSRRVLGQDLTNRFMGNLTIGKHLDNIIGLLHQGKVEQARQLAEQAYKVMSDNFAIANSYAFCTIPTDPTKAVELIQMSCPRTLEHQVLKTVNYVSALLFSQGFDAAHSHLRAAVKNCQDTPYANPRNFLLWEPISLTRGYPTVRHMSIQEWIDGLNHLVNG